MLVAAPGRFSTTNGWPSRSDSHCPVSRGARRRPRRPESRRSGAPAGSDRLRARYPRPDRQRGSARGQMQNCRRGRVMSGLSEVIMWQRSPFRYGLGVELDAELLSLARKNVAQFHLEDRIHILQADIRFLGLGHLQSVSPVASPSGFDTITANPPYWPADRGRLNPDLQKAAARHEISLTLAELVAAVRRFLKPGGRLYLSHLDSRQDEILGRIH